MSSGTLARSARHARSNASSGSRAQEGYDTKGSRRGHRRSSVDAFMIRSQVWPRPGPRLAAVRPRSAQA